MAQDATNALGADDNKSEYEVQALVDLTPFCPNRTNPTSPNLEVGPVCKWEADSDELLPGQLYATTLWRLLHVVPTRLLSIVLDLPRCKASEWPPFTSETIHISMDPQYAALSFVRLVRRAAQAVVTCSVALSWCEQVELVQTCVPQQTCGQTICTFTETCCTHQGKPRHASTFW